MPKKITLKELREKAENMAFEVYGEPGVVAIKFTLHGINYECQADIGDIYAVEVKDPRKLFGLEETNE